VKQKITRSFIENLNQSVNIVNFMEDNYHSDFLFSKSSDWANTNCPLPNHEDNSPSFGVNISNNKYNCFGCNAKGDLINLVQEVEGLNFVEAIQKIALYANIDIETTDLDMKYLVNELQDSIKKYLKQSEELSDFPGGLDEIHFLLAMSQKVKKFERKYNFDVSVINWTEKYYKDLENHIANQDFKQIKILWKNFSKNSEDKARELGL
jgi:hypothetical protein